ncbi:unnamed protein product [Linum trigynum]|uniref:Uncharacterized protein n=1 Tax=Linum trigynum TaxID=586398 RepID=A0AAV2GLF3_9ROSI
MLSSRHAYASLDYPELLRIPADQAIDDDRCRRHKIYNEGAHRWGRNGKVNFQATVGKKRGRRSLPPIMEVEKIVVGIRKERGVNRIRNSMDLRIR